MPNNDVEQKKFQNRLVGEMPRIGIRPVVDGRRGVRDAVESQTRELSRAVAALLETNLRHPNGLPVECVVPPVSIGGVTEAAMVSELFSKENVAVSITVTSCWAYGSETMDMDIARPKAIWGFNGTESPGAVYLSATTAAHDQKGLPVFKIYGKNVQDMESRKIPPDVRKKLLQFAKAGLAATYMKGKTYLSIGNVSMGIAGSIVDHRFFEQYLGMRVVTVDSTEFIRRIEKNIFDQAEFRKASEWVEENCKEGPDPNPPERQRSREQKDEDWEFVIKMAIAARDLMIGNPVLDEIGYGEEALGHNAIAAGFQGQRQWTDYYPNGDFMEAILNSSFDWNGARQPLIMATENDSLNAVPMLFGHLLTNRAQIFADVRTYWSPEAVERVTQQQLGGRMKDGMIHLINSGSAALDGTGEMEENGKPVMKPFWEISQRDIEGSLKATTWYPGLTGYFRGGGYSSQYMSRGEMPVTMSRVNLIEGVGPILQIAEGWIVEPPYEVHTALNERTDPTWPTHWFVPRLERGGSFESVYEVMDYWGANHAVVSYGHIGADLITLASMLRIPVAMHNVPRKSIFRPTYWNGAGGSREKEADFRSCRTLGPLYGV